jgi:tetratricopeptide (TPR) repeat protein
MRVAIERRLALSGRVNRETAVLYNSFGIILTAAHRLDEALDAYRETLSIYHSLGLGDEIDAQIVSANMGGLLIRTGNPREAEPLLREAIQHERELAGNSGALASALGYYGRLMSLTDRPEQALTTLTEGTAVATQFTGPASPLTVQNRLFLGEAQLAAGARSTARATLTENERIAMDQYGANHPLTLRTRLALARVSLADGHTAEAQAQLAAILPGLRHNGAQTVEELAQASNLIHPAQLAK